MTTSFAPARTSRSAFPGAALLILFAVPALALGAGPQELNQDQARHELGLRLRALERVYEAAESRPRRAALPDTEAAVQAFFAGRLGPAGERLDAARRAVAGEVGPGHRAEPWTAIPGKRFLETSEERIALSFLPLYPPAEPLGSAAWTLSWRWLGPEEGEVQGFLVRPEPHPAARTLELELPGPGFELPLEGAGEGDLWLELGLGQGEGPVWIRTLRISRAPSVAERLEALDQTLSRLPADKSSLEASSARGLAALLRELRQGGTPETELPAARLLAEAEALAAAALAGETRIGPDHPGEHHLWLARPDGRPAAARLFVPEGLGQARVQGEPAPRVPLVIALHGAGGSENLFFDGHGDGKAVRLAEQRGWMLIAPRLGFFGSGAIGEWADALAERFPIDDGRLFLVGHSMGGGAALAEVVRRPGRYAALAAVGAGGSPRDRAALIDLPVLIAPGERDFALGGARALHNNLVEAGHSRARLWVVPDSEHLLVVQAALDEVFALFDSVPVSANERER